VQNDPGRVSGFLLVCREDLKKFMGISKSTNVGQMPGQTLGFLFYFLVLCTLGGGLVKRGQLYTGSKDEHLKNGVTGG
jgi:hypothetical protein